MSLIQPYHMPELLRASRQKLLTTARVVKSCQELQGELGAGKLTLPLHNGFQAGSFRERERDEVLIGNHRERLQTEPAQAPSRQLSGRVSLPAPSSPLAKRAGPSTIQSHYFDTNQRPLQMKWCPSTSQSINHKPLAGGADRCGLSRAQCYPKP